MEGESDMNKMDQLPGFRFHPTDEELVGFYLKRKIQQRALPVELIKQVDIYKYDPWDLPKLACSGEKEWYFYCPRDRKYRNSARPNRVTVAGFWKATGTDRPIYSSNGTECIGLKKSLVFYRGRAAKGIKTDWMMHEFRLPCSSTSALQPKNVPVKTLAPNDSWAICRVFKKTSTMAQRALSRSWVSSMHDTSSSDYILNHGVHYNIFSPEPISCTTETSSPILFPNDDLIHYNSISSFPALEVPAYKPIFNPTLVKSYPFPFSTGYVSPLDMAKGSIDVASIPFNISDSFSTEGTHQTINGVLSPLPDKKMITDYNDNDWGNTELVGFPFCSSLNVLDTSKTDFIWDSPLCPSDISATFSTNLCNT